MDQGRLDGRRVLVTSADTYMGPAVVELFRAEGADVVVDTGDLVGPDDPERLVADAWPFDAVVANLDLGAYLAPPTEIDDDEWMAGFDTMVHPLMRLVRSTSQRMIERGAGGAIVAITSSSPLRRMSPQAVSYVTARAAQNAFVRSAGHALARHGVRLNAIAQNYIANDTYYPPELVETERFQDRLRVEVPARRLGTGAETAELALFLVGETSSFICGQIVSNDGGWS